MSSEAPVIQLDHFIGLNTLSINPTTIFHPNGKNFIYSLGCNLIIADTLDVNSQVILSRNNDFITAFALSNDGNLLASGCKGYNSDIIIWNFNTHEIIYIFEEFDNYITSLSFSHDNKILCSLGYILSNNNFTSNSNNTMNILNSNNSSKNQGEENMIYWDMSSGNIITSTNKLKLNKTNSIKFINYVKDIKNKYITNKYLLYSFGDSGLVAWELDPFVGQLSSEKISNDSRTDIVRNVISIDKNYSETLLYATTLSGDILVINMKTKRIIQSINVNSIRNNALSVISDLESGLIVIGGSDQMIRVLYEDNFGKYVISNDKVQLDGEVIGLSLSYDKLEAIATTSHGSIYRVNLSTLQYITLHEGHIGAITSLAFKLVNGKGIVGSYDKLASTSTDGTIRIWDLVDYTAILCIKPKPQTTISTPFCLVFSVMLLTGWSDGRIVAYSCENGEFIWSIDNAHSDGVSTIALSHNGRFILSGGMNGDIRLWDLRTRDLISHLKEHKSRVTSIVISDDDTQCISSSKDKSILRWDLRSEKRLDSHIQRMGAVNSVVYSLDEKYIISVGQEKRLTYWDIKQHDPVHQQLLDKELDEGKSIARSYNGKYIVTGGTGGEVRLWDYDSSRLLSVGVGHHCCINSIQFSPDDKQVVSGGEDGSIFLWNVF